MDADRLVAADEAGAGEDYRLEQVAFGADAGDARQIGADLASQVADRMTDDARGLLMVEDIVKDIRYGTRLFARNPIFTVTAALSLAIGIGADTTPIGD